MLFEHWRPFPTGPDTATESVAAPAPVGSASSEWPDESATVPLASDMCQTPT